MNSHAEYLKLLYESGESLSERQWDKLYQKIRIYDNGDSVRCVSYNKEEYPDFEVPKKFIYGYYRCVGVLKIL